VEKPVGNWVVGSDKSLSQADLDQIAPAAVKGKSQTLSTHRSIGCENKQSSIAAGLSNLSIFAY